MTYEGLNNAVLTVSSEIEEMAKVTLSAEQRQRLNDVMTQFLESEGIEVVDSDVELEVTNEADIKSDSGDDMAASNTVIDTESGPLVKIDVSEEARRVAEWKSLPEASSALVETLIAEAKESLDTMDERLEKLLDSIRDLHAAALNMEKEDKEDALRHLRANFQSTLALALKPREEIQAFIKAQRTKREDAIRYGATVRLGRLEVNKVISNKVEKSHSGLTCFCCLDTKDGVYLFSFQGSVTGECDMLCAHFRVMFDLNKE